MTANTSLQTRVEYSALYRILYAWSSPSKCATVLLTGVDAVNTVFRKCNRS